MGNRIRVLPPGHQARDVGPVSYTHLISIVEEVYDAAEERRRKARTALLVAHKKAAGFFHRLLLCSPKAAEARAYLNSRGYGADMAKRWQVGLSLIHI